MGDYHQQIFESGTANLQNDLGTAKHLIKDDLELHVIIKDCSSTSTTSDKTIIFSHSGQALMVAFKS